MNTVQRICDFIASLPNPHAQAAGLVTIRALSHGAKPAQVLRYLRMRYEIKRALPEYSPRIAGCYLRPGA